MPNIRDFSTPSLGLRPSETGVDAAASAARSVAAFAAQLSGATGELASETGKLGSQTAQLGARTEQLGADKQREFKTLGNLASSDIQAGGEAYVNFRDHQQISAGGPLFTRKFNELDQAWNKRISDPNLNPNDPSVAADFNEKALQPTLDELLKGFTTEKSQAYAEKMINDIRSHFALKTSADMAVLAAKATRQNIQEMTSQLSNAVTDDPTSVRTALTMIETSLRGKILTSPNLKGTDTQALLNEVLFQSQSAIVKSAAVGAIAKNPDAGLKTFGAPEWSKWIDGTELKQLQQQAKTVERAQRVDENYALQNQKLFKQEVSDTREREYMVKLHSDDPNERSAVSAKAIASDFTLTREASQRMIGLVNREIKPETDTRISAQTSVGIMRMLRDPNVDQEKVRTAILEARTKDPGTPGSLTKGDMTDLQKQVDDLKTPQGVALAADRSEFFKQYSPTIDPEMKLGNPTPLGAQGIYRAEKDARRQEQVLRSKGLDPHLLYDPSSDYFLGKPDRIGSYRPSLAEKAAYDAQLKADQKRPAGAPAKSVNLTGDGSTVTGIQTLEIPAGMSPADAMKWAKDKGAKEVRLPDGRIGTVK